MNNDKNITENIVFPPNSLPKKINPIVNKTMFREKLIMEIGISI
jgi:hypothetical protein